MKAYNFKTMSLKDRFKGMRKNRRECLRRFKKDKNELAMHFTFVSQKAHTL